MTQCRGYDYHSGKLRLDGLDISTLRWNPHEQEPVRQRLPSAAQNKDCSQAACMQLDINDKWAVVCGASKGLGYACALQLAREGVNIVLVARTESALMESAERIRQETNVPVIAVAADIATGSGRDQVLHAAPQVDILVNNAGGPPPGDFRDFSREDWLAALDANMLAPIE